MVCFPEYRRATVSKKGGILKKLYVDDGEKIKNGQWIAKIEGESTLKSPGEATVLRANYLEKEYVPPGHTIVSLIISEYIDVVFYVPEKDISNIKMGKKVALLIQGKQYPVKMI